MKSYGYVRFGIIYKGELTYYNDAACYAFLGHAMNTNPHDEVLLALYNYKTDNERINIYYDQIINNMNELFGKFVTFYGYDTDNFFVVEMKFNKKYTVKINTSIVSAIFSVLRYIDNEYFESMKSSTSSNIIRDIKTFKDILYNGELIKNGYVGHNAHDTLTSKFKIFDDVIVDNYIYFLSILSESILTDKKFEEIYREYLSKVDTNYSWLGQSVNYNLLALSVRRYLNA
jgi:hypothetical protein